MAQSVSWSLFLEFLCSFKLLFPLQHFVLFEMSFDISELLEQGIMLKNFEVLQMKIGFIGTLELSLWLSGVNTLEDAQSSKVLKS